MQHGGMSIRETHENSWRTQLLPNILALALLANGHAYAGDQEAKGMQKIEGSIWYRERILLPPSAEIHVYLEDAARMDTPSEVVASTSITPHGGPPWSFSLPYDPKTLHERGRYILRVRIEADGRLLFINTQSIPAFAGDASAPLEIRVSRVPSSRPADVTEVPDVSLTDTYWKLVEIEGQEASLGAGQLELHMVLTSDGHRVRGFSGCNRFTGSYERNGDRIQLAQLASTRMACVDADAMEQEQRFLNRLREAQRFTIHGDELAIYSGDAHLVLRFLAVALH